MENLTNSKPMDIYGFMLNKKNNNSDLTEKTPFEIKKNNARIEKWRLFMNKIDKIIEKKGKSSKLKKKLRKGIPDCFRGFVWPKLAQTNMTKLENNINFKDLLIKESDAKLEISLDVPRTFPDNLFFTNKDVGQTSLTNVLHALSILYKDLGYCQGLNFLAGLFVLYMNDEESFLVLASILKRSDLKENYRDLKNIHRVFFVYEQLTKKYLPKIFQIFKKFEITSDLYASSWFIALFAINLPFKVVVRIIDIFLYEGYKIIYRIALAVLKIKEKEILNCKEFENVLLCLNNFKNEIFQNDDLIIKIANSFHFSKKRILKLEIQYNKNINEKK